MLGSRVCVRLCVRIYVCMCVHVYTRVTIKGLIMCVSKHKRSYMQAYVFSCGYLKKLLGTLASKDSIAALA